MSQQANFQLLLRQRDRVIATLSRFIQHASRTEAVTNIDEAEECLDFLNRSWTELISIEDQLIYAQNQQPTHQIVEAQYFQARTNLKSKLRLFNVIHSSNSTVNNGHGNVHFEQFHSRDQTTTYQYHSL